MTLADPHDQISRLEGRIEELSESVERCRKIAIAARSAIVAGGVLLAVILLGLVRADGALLILVGILGIGGVVLYGSNDSTAKQMAAGIDEAERRRAELISGIDLTLVREPIAAPALKIWLDSACAETSRERKP